MLPDCGPHTKYIDMLQYDIGGDPCQYLNWKGVKIICIEIEFLIDAISIDERKNQSEIRRKQTAATAVSNRVPNQHKP